MRGVKFGEFHTAEDWDLILNAKSLTPPVPKTNYIAVEGARRRSRFIRDFNRRDQI